jgi:hypothetical protein
MGMCLAVGVAASQKMQEGNVGKSVGLQLLDEQSSRCCLIACRYRQISSLGTPFSAGRYLRPSCTAMVAF